jgi:hypothetical protein
MGLRYAPAQPSASTDLRFAPSEARPISYSEFGTNSNIERVAGDGVVTQPSSSGRTGEEEA